jgi:hypothetical protein
MSKKYVPSFLKDQNAPASSNFTAPIVPANTGTRSFWPNKTENTAALPVKNQFAAFSDDAEPTINTTKQRTFAPKPVVNTSLPAKEAPKLAPATLASITSINGTTANGVTVVTGGSGAKKSFASKFAEKVKIEEDPDYKPPPKPIDFGSEDDFPTLGAPSKPLALALVKPTQSAGPQAPKFDAKFAEKAKEWAEQKKAEEEAEKKRRYEEARRHHKESIMSSGIHIIKHTFANSKNSESDEEYNPNYDEEGIDDDDYLYNVDEDELNSMDGEEDEENEDNELNSDVGSNRRHKNDLY